MKTNRNQPGAQPAEAETILESHNWQVEAAVATWFASQDGGEQDMRDAQDASSDDEAETENAPAPPVPSVAGGGGGGRTLGGDGVASRFVPGLSAAPAPAPVAGGSRRGGGAAGARGGAGGMRTLGDLQRDSHAGHGHDDDDDEDQDMFAGGEKSGLAVQNPNSGNPRDEVERMLNRARRYVCTHLLLCYRRCTMKTERLTYAQQKHAPPTPRRRRRRR
jgi:UBX domain-containing protein 1